VASERLLGVIADADGDEIEISADGDGTATLEWEHGSAMVLGPVARDRLRELLDRAAMPGQPAPGLFGHCAHCGRDCAVRHTIPCPDGCNNAERQAEAHAADDEAESEAERQAGAHEAVPGA
jgi:hypothetical protein